MAFISKLVCNRLGWTIPSGLDGKNENIQSKLFEAIYHFGFEEWLFNESHSVTLDGNIYNFGYIDGLKNLTNLPQEIYLTTKVYKNSNYPNGSESHKLIGKICGVKRLTENNFRSIFIQHENLMDSFEADLRNIFVERAKLDSALRVLRKAKDDGWLFNVIFESAYRYKLPEAHENWDYLVTPHGYNGVLPSNFSLREVPDNKIVDILKANPMDMERLF